jgi:hypothetical protein
MNKITGCVAEEIGVSAGKPGRRIRTKCHPKNKAQKKNSFLREAESLPHEASSAFQNQIETETQAESSPAKLQIAGARSALQIVLALQR